MIVIKLDTSTIVAFVVGLTIGLTRKVKMERTKIESNKKGFKKALHEVIEKEN